MRGGGTAPTGQNTWKNAFLRKTANRMLKTKHLKPKMRMSTRSDTVRPAAAHCGREQQGGVSSLCFPPAPGRFAPPHCRTGRNRSRSPPCRDAPRPGNPLFKQSFKQEKYNSMKDLISEKYFEFIEDILTEKDVVVLAGEIRHNQRILDLPKSGKIIMSILATV